MNMDELIGVLEYNDYYSRMDSVRFAKVKQLVMKNLLLTCLNRICKTGQIIFQTHLNVHFTLKLKNGIFINDNMQKLSYNLRYEILSILCSTHKLAIEQGRHLNEPRENKLCQIWNYNELEDEYHFVHVCPILSDVRRNFLTSVV